MSKRLTSSRVFWYAIVAAIGFVFVMALIYPFVQTAVVPWWNNLLGIKEKGEVPEGFIYTGNLKVNLNAYDVYDDSVVTPTGIVYKIWHADEKTLFGSRTGAGSDTITGEVTEADAGTLYLSVDHVATTIYYTLDSESEEASSYLTALSPKDIDDDGILEHYFKVDVSGLAPLAAGETQKEITINTYYIDADVSGLDITSITNPSDSGLSGSSYVDLYAGTYVAAVTRGDGFKLVRAEMYLPDSGNRTYYEDGKVKNVWMSLVGDSDTTYKWTTYSYDSAGGASGYGNFRFFEATDVTQEVYGKPVVYDRNMADKDVCKITVHIQGANFAASAVWNPTIKLTFIDPAGTISTDTLAITFTDT